MVYLGKYFMVVVLGDIVYKCHLGQVWSVVVCKCYVSYLFSDFLVSIIEEIRCNFNLICEKMGFSVCLSLFMLL